MKSLFFTIALGFMGVYSFGTNSSPIEEYGCTDWSTFESCGSTFYLCNSNFDSAEELMDFAEEMHELRCN